MIKLGVVILAAGSSSRLGYPKQLVEFRGKKLLQHIVEVAESLEFSTQILVLGARAEEILERINLSKFKTVIHKSWEEGMGTSISKGISEALESEKDLEHILILVSDQPFVTKGTLQELVTVHLNNNMPATFSEYAGDVGVPAIFSRQLFSDLKELKGNHGAKKLLFNKNLEFETFKFERGNFDVDTSADVELLKQMEKK
ncbi:nucleotidyltransferase family protein [Autumnicola psychrophila]|uniref:Nucleotidyltransferase family protein n=1 Tax=Autumnicola psychrophila TaxID=3075592 RepID=A0ABU3DVG5_9FLAO|nr:nucleotidyltransferase family protein [Zunongwangia sp. F225]MDT0687699.1 nucleotidyltransferase family protein [Zunongwangia sp. F225]